MNVESFPARNDDVVSQRGPDEVTILLDTASGEYYTLDDVGGRIWELCDGARTVAQIADALALEYEAAPEEIQADLIELLDELVSNGLLRA